MADVQLTALNWSVAQNTQLQNVHIKLAEYSGNDDKGQVGMRMGRGSSLAHSGVIIEGGQVRTAVLSPMILQCKLTYHG